MYASPVDPDPLSRRQMVSLKVHKDAGSLHVIKELWTKEMDGS